MQSSCRWRWTPSCSWAAAASASRPARLSCARWRHGQNLLSVECSCKRKKSSHHLLQDGMHLSFFSYPVMRKCRFGVGMSGAMSPIRSLFMYDGYRSVAVDVDMMVETSSLIWEKLGLVMWSLSTAILLRAVLSRTTTQSADWVSRFRVSSELYGCTTTSEAPMEAVTTPDEEELVSWFGKTLYVWTSFFGYLQKKKNVITCSLKLPRCFGPFFPHTCLPASPRCRTPFQTLFHPQWSGQGQSLRGSHCHQPHGQ